MIQYIVVFTALGISRSYCDFKGVQHKDSAIQVALQHASETMFFAPMACLMFIGFRMRVLQLTKGEGNPQPWARMCMEFVMYSITANTVIALIIPVFKPPAGVWEGEIPDVSPRVARTPSRARLCRRSS